MIIKVYWKKEEINVEEKIYVALKEIIILLFLYMEVREDLYLNFNQV